MRLGSFTLGQWAQITAAGALAAVFGGYVSPLPMSATIFVSIVAAGLPVALSYGAMGAEFSVGHFASAAWRYWRAPPRYLPGPGASACGYVVSAEPIAEARPAAPSRSREGAGEALWDL